MRTYEQLFILRPDAAQEEIDGFLEPIQNLITGAGGQVEKLEKWGLRKLAYRVDKHNDGYYVLLQFSASADVVKEIERRFRVSDLVLKFLTVRIDRKLKWLEKRKKLREKRAQRRPAVVRAAPEAVSMPGEPIAEE